MKKDQKTKLKKVKKPKLPVEDSPVEERSENEEQMLPAAESTVEEQPDNENGMDCDDAGSSDENDRKKRRKVTPLIKKAKNKAGIIYISSIPKHMNVTLLRGLLEPYGEIGRIYLEPERKDGKVRKKTAQGKHAMMRYTEGWVEFLRKSIAKQVVELLNTKPISTSRKSVFCDILWTMKYLPRFKWVNLSERLAYERAVAREKLRAEIVQTRAEASVFESAVSASAAIKLKKKGKKKNLKEDSENA